MSRKWERMIQKNSKLVNKQRKNLGNQTIVGSGQEVDRFVGKNLFLPILLIGFSIFFMIAFGGVYSGASYWFTVSSYLLLGLYLFFFRRPYLYVGISHIKSRRFTGHITVDAGDIEQITLQKGYIIINVKGKHSKWVFSRLINRFDTDKMAERLKQFASQNSVELIEQT